ncbi:phage antirepressor KilAC domain-containing protein [Pseudomonas farris]
MQSQPNSSNTPNHVATRFVNSENVSRTTMSSREIADLVESRHDSVKRTIERLSIKGIIRFTPSVETSHEGAGAREVEVYNINKRDSFVVVAQLCPEFTARLVDRWQELEEMVIKPAFNYAAALNDPRTLLALLTDNVKKVVALEADNTELSHENLMLEQKVAADAPKTAFFDAVTVTHETYSVAEAAKLIGTGQNRLMAFLRQRRWVTIRKNEPMQGPIESGYLTAKLSTFEHPENGKTTVSTPRVTGKGLTKLQALWARRDADLLGGVL